MNEFHGTLTIICFIKAKLGFAIIDIIISYFPHWHHSASIGMPQCPPRCFAAIKDTINEQFSQNSM
jgi:hypothetical protein